MTIPQHAINLRFWWNFLFGPLVIPFVYLTALWEAQRYAAAEIARADFFGRLTMAGVFGLQPNQYEYGTFVALSTPATLHPFYWRDTRPDRMPIANQGPSFLRFLPTTDLLIVIGAGGLIVDLSHLLQLLIIMAPGSRLAFTLRQDPVDVIVVGREELFDAIFDRMLGLNFNNAQAPAAILLDEIGQQRVSRALQSIAFNYIAEEHNRVNPAAMPLAQFL